MECASHPGWILGFHSAVCVEKGFMSFWSFSVSIHISGLPASTGGTVGTSLVEYGMGIFHSSISEVPRHAQ